MMKKRLVYGFVIIVACIIQTSLLPIFFERGVPLLLPMMMLAWSLIDGFDDFFWWALFAGIFADLVGPGVIGINVISFVLIIYTASFLSRRFSGDIRGVGVFLMLALVMAATLISAIASLISFLPANEFVLDFSRIHIDPVKIMLQIVYNAILFFACHIFISRMKKFFDIQ